MIDFMVTEAVVIKTMKEEADMRDNAHREKWKKDTSDLDKYR